jgi:hypothetical protein
MEELNENASGAAGVPGANSLMPSPPPQPVRVLHADEQSFGLWLACARPGDRAIYWAAPGAGNAGRSPRAKAAIFAAAWKAWKAGSVALFQCRDKGPKVGSATPFNYLAVRLSPRATNWLNKVGEEAEWPRKRGRARR